jgi:(heptosyl)LPS beta-1,4-glucosyltransferase
MDKKLTAIIITKNEEQMIRDCLISVTFADEIIVVDTGNTDFTNKIAGEYQGKIVTSLGLDYAQFRNDGLKKAASEWVLYVDADERVTPLLREEIKKVINYKNSAAAYAIPRQNMFLGKHMHYGGWGDDHVIRLFRRSQLSGWRHPLHEEPVYDGKLKKLQNYLVHFSHRDLNSMLEKTLNFTGYEAQLRLEAHHPPIVAWRIVRVMATEFWKRFVVLQAWKDGPEGIIDGMFQVFNTFIIYARLWELQLKASRSASR